MTDCVSMDERMRGRALRILFVTVFLDLLGFGLILPQLPFYAKRCGADGTVVGAIGASYSLLQFLFAPFWGRISDRIGRRPVIMIGLAGSGLSFLVFGAAFHIHAWTGLGLIPLLFVSRGMAGLFNANISTAQAYVADIMPADRRAAGMGLIGAAFGLGFVLGPAFSAVLGQWGGPELPFYVAGASGLITAIAAYFVLPESRPDSARTEPAAGQGRRRWMPITALPAGALRTVLFLFFSSTFAMGVMENTLGLFVEADDALRFAPRDFAYLLVFVGVVIVVTQGFMVKRLSALFGERKLILAGSLVMVFGLGLIGYVPGTWALYFLMALVGFGNGILNPSLATMTSLLAEEGVRGEVMGMGQSMSALGRIAGPFLGGVVYEHVAHEVAYLMSGVMMILTFALALHSLGTDRESHSPTQSR